MVGFCHGGNVPSSHDDDEDEYDEAIGDDDNIAMEIKEIKSF